MARNYMSSAALCPFYRYEEPVAIYCEGLEPGSTLKLFYRDGKKLDRFKARHCYGDWKKCPIARTLWSKYEPGETEIP